MHMQSEQYTVFKILLPLVHVSAPFMRHPQGAQVLMKYVYANIMGAKIEIK
jgi:hypothetical protein